MADLREASEATMRDECQIGIRSAASRNDPGAVTWAWSAALVCGLSLSTRGEVAGNGSQATLTDAVLRLPWGTDVTGIDRVRITKIAGETLDVAQEYAADGAPYGTLANLVVRLKRLIGASGR
jgi:hypothetical protein